MISKSPIVPQRIRRIPDSFSWIDHRLLHQGFIRRMQPNDMLLYFFLVLVGDKNGVSYYSYDKMCDLLKLSLDDLLSARDCLIDMSLLAVANGKYQVLALPCSAGKASDQRNQHMTGINQLLQDMGLR